MTINADIDRIFKDGLNEFAPKAPSYIWDHIEQNLDHRKNKNRRTFIYSIAASVAILVAFGAGYLITNNNTGSSIEKSTIAVIDSTQNTQPSDQKQVQPLADDKDELENSVKTEITLPNNDSQKENQKVDAAKKNKPKAIRAISSGSMLPPIFGKEVIKNDSQMIVKDTNSIINDTIK